MVKYPGGDLSKGKCPRLFLDVGAQICLEAIYRVFRWTVILQAGRGGFFKLPSAVLSLPFHEQSACVIAVFHSFIH